MHGVRTEVLVTGGSGFIGSHVVDRLAAAGHRPRILDTRPSPWHDLERVDTVIGDICRLEDVRRAMRGCVAVCHLAAAADVGEVHAHPVWATELNGGGTLNVLEAAREAGVKRVVYASTVWVYSDTEADEVDEDTPLAHPAHLYTAGKLSGELYCHSYRELYGLEPTILRFGIPYGPRARPAAVIPSFVERARRGEPLTIAGTGEQERSFVYVEDLADGVVRALVPAAAGRTYNLAGRETATIRQLAEIVSDQVAETPIVHTPGRAGDLRGARVNSDRAERELGWRASTPLDEGVRRYAAWLEQQPPRAAELPVRTLPGEAGVRRVLALLAAGLRHPAIAGLVALIAVTSATVSVVVGSREETQGVDFAVIGVALLLPLWPLTVAVWPRERQRLQCSLIALLGAFDVLLLGLLSSGSGGGGVHAMRVGLVLALSACLAAALRVLPFGRVERTT
jgi:UDP-glucose 4-epimerase